VYGCNGRGVKEFSHPLKQLRGHTNVVYRAGARNRTMRIEAFPD